MSFVTRTLGEICDEVDGIVQTGPFGSQLHRSDYRDEGTPVVMPKDLVGNKVSVESIARIGDKDVSRLARHKLKKGDIVYARRGDIGRRALVTEHEDGWMCGTGCMRISLGDSVVHPVFLHYYLGQPGIVTWIYNQSIGATMPNLNTSIVRSIPITYPPLPTQRKIAAILSAYDDLIENNTRRIALLEQTAQILYREWFVHFRFPGHESVPLVESELGPIPEKWEVEPIGEAIQAIGGGTPSKKKPEYWVDGTITWYIPSDLTSTKSMFISDSRRKINQLGLKRSSAKLFPPYSVMMTSRATVGVVSINTTSACTNQGFITCIPNDRLPVYLIYFWITENREKIIALASGATFKEINKTTFRKIPIVIPDTTTHSRFLRVVEPIGQEIQNLLTKNQILRRTRDLLLPRLISGQLDVSELDIAIGEINR